MWPVGPVWGLGTLGDIPGKVTSGCKIEEVTQGGDGDGDGRIDIEGTACMYELSAERQPVKSTHTSEDVWIVGTKLP